MTTSQPAELPAHSAMFAALAVPNFRRYVSGQSLSLIGTWVETVAQALLVLRLTHSGTALGLTTAARYAPILLLSPYAALLVDRYAKRRILLGTQAGLGLVSATLGAAVLAGDIRLWQVVVLAVLFGILSAVDNPARQAFVQEVVGHELVRNAVTLICARCWATATTPPRRWPGCCALGLRGATPPRITSPCWTRRSPRFRRSTGGG